MKVAHLARKPLSQSSVSQNVLAYGTGSINIDASRVGLIGGMAKTMVTKEQGTIYGKGLSGKSFTTPLDAGRWPANLTLLHKPKCQCVGTKQIQIGTANFNFQGEMSPESLEYTETVEDWNCVEGCPVAELDGPSHEGGMHPSGKGSITRRSAYSATSYSSVGSEGVRFQGLRAGDSGGASRFFKQFQMEDT